MKGFLGLGIAGKISDTQSSPSPFRRDHDLEGERFVPLSLPKASLFLDGNGRDWTRRIQRADLLVGRRCERDALRRHDDAPLCLQEGGGDRRQMTSAIEGAPR